jgi:hypothetical protein
MSFLLSLMFSVQQNWRREQNRLCLKAKGVKGTDREAGGRELKRPKKCIHVNK